FDKASSEPLAKRFAQLSATSATAPELIIEQTLQGAKQTITYKQVTARDISAGKVKSFGVAGATMAMAGGPTPISGTFGPMSVSDLDMVLMLRLYTDKA